MVHSTVCHPWPLTLKFAILEIQNLKFRGNLLFSWAYSAETVRPPSKLTRERHILGMLTRPRNDSHCPKFCHWSCSLIANTRVLAVFGTCKIPSAEIWKIFTCMHMNIFQQRSKLVQDKWHVLASLGATPGVISPCIFCECAL